MDPMLFVLIVFVTIATVGGAWGWVILNGLMKRRAIKLESKLDDPRVGELEEAQALLERYRDDVEH